MTRVTLVVSLLTLVLLNPAANGATYKCKDAAGNWTEVACTGAAAPPPKPEDPEAAMKARRAGWEKLCDSRSWDYTRNCMADHERGYREMDRILKGPPSSLRDKAATCYLRWFKEAANVVDGKMWRHCYYN
mgnify:CR=1 FL=1